MKVFTARHPRLVLTALSSAVLLGGALSLLSATPAAAVSGNAYFSGGGACSRGYGSNTNCTSKPFYNSDVLYGRDAGGDALQPWEYASKGAFIQAVKNRLNSGRQQDRTGAAFIINTMVGAPPGQRQKNPSAQMIADWESRINNPGIGFFATSASPGNYGPTSFYDRVRDDNFFANWSGSNRILIFFTDGNGNPLYIVEAPCGNPVGNLPGLPPAPQPQPYTRIQLRLFVIDASGRTTITNIRGADYVTCNPNTRNKTLTDVNGWAFFEVPQGQGFCIRAGPPPPGSGWSGPFIRPWGPQQGLDGWGYGFDPVCQAINVGQPPGGTPGSGFCYPNGLYAGEHGSYEWQVAGADARSWPASPGDNPGWRYYDRAVDSGYDIVYVAKQGYVDIINCNNAQGWVFDVNKYDWQMTLDVWKDGAFGARYGGVAGEPGRWNGPRNDVASWFNLPRDANGNDFGHGFILDFNNRGLNLNDGRPHSIQLYALGFAKDGSNDGNNIKIFDGTVGPCLSYTLTPRVSAPAAASRSDTVQFTFTVDNSGPTVTPPTQWWTRGRYILSGQPYDPQPQQDANRGSSGGYREQSGTQVFQVGSSQVFVESVDMSRIPANAAYVCRSLTVYPFDSNQPPRYRTSAEQCVAVGKQPLAQVTGGDLWAGGSFRNSSGSCAAGTGANVKGTAKTYPDGTRAGSWGEYGVFALGSVSAFGSAGFTTDQAPLSSKLTFANTYAGTLGYYFGQAPPIAQYCLSDFWQAAQNMPGPRTTGNETLYDPANLPGGVYTTTATGRVDINTNDRPIPAGTQIVIYAPSAGTVYIKDNIVYQPASYRSPADLPRVIIISGGDIQINHHVDTIDAWLSAAKTLQTCDVGMGEAAESPQCLYPPVSTKPLRFNGPVVATNLKLLRVYGADNNLGANRTTPAELFNLRSDAYLSAYWSSLITGNARTVYQQEAPARY